MTEEEDHITKILISEKVSKINLLKEFCMFLKTVKYFLIVPSGLILSFVFLNSLLSFLMKFFMFLMFFK